MTIEHLQVCLPQHLLGFNDNDESNLSNLKQEFCLAFHKLTDSFDSQRPAVGSMSVVEERCKEERQNKPQQQLTHDGAMRAIVRAMDCTQTGFAVTFQAKLFPTPSSDTSASHVTDLSLVHPVEVAINQTGIHLSERNSARPLISFWLSTQHARTNVWLSTEQHNDLTLDDDWSNSEELHGLLFEWHTLKHLSGMLFLRALCPNGFENLYERYTCLAVRLM